MSRTGRAVTSSSNWTGISGDAGIQTFFGSMRNPGSPVVAGGELTRAQRAESLANAMSRFITDYSKGFPTRDLTTMSNLETNTADPENLSFQRVGGIKLSFPYGTGDAEYENKVIPDPMKINGNTLSAHAAYLKGRRERTLGGGWRFLDYAFRDRGESPDDIIARRLYGAYLCYAPFPPNNVPTEYRLAIYLPSTPDRSDNMDMNKRLRYFKTDGEDVQGWKPRDRLNPSTIDESFVRLMDEKYQAYFTKETRELEEQLRRIPTAEDRVIETLNYQKSQLEKASQKRFRLFFNRNFKTDRDLADIINELLSSGGSLTEESQNIVDTAIASRSRLQQLTASRLYSPDPRTESARLRMIARIGAAAELNIDESQLTDEQFEQYMASRDARMRRINPLRPEDVGSGQDFTDQPRLQNVPEVSGNGIPDAGSFEDAEFLQLEETFNNGGYIHLANATCRSVTL